MTNVPPTIEERIARLEEILRALPPIEPVPATGLMGKVGEMIAQAMHSKQFWTMLTTNSALLVGLHQIIDKHPSLAKWCIAGVAVVTCTYILAQSAAKVAFAVKK